MKKFLLATTAAAIATGFSGLAMAAANLDTQQGSGGIYASELVIPAVGGTSLEDGAAADQQATVTLGAAFGLDTAAYVRYDLSSGTFTAAPTLGVAGGTAQISQGGAGQTFVIFQVSPAQGQSLPLSTVLTLQGNGVTVTNQNAVSLQYRLYETLTAAVNQTPGTVLKTASATYLSFDKVINVATDTVPDAVADVAAANGPYTAFVPVAAPTPTYSRQVSNFHVTYTQRALANGTGTAGPGDILGATNSVKIDGDWSAAENAHIHTSPTCSIGSFAFAGTIAADKQSASFGPLSAAGLTQQHWYVCYEIDQPNSIAIPVSDFTGTIDLVPANANVTVSDAATAPGRIIRNGTVLKAAFAETPVAGFSGTVNLTNTSTRVASFSTSCLTPTGRVAGNPGSVAANSAARFGIGSSLGCPTNTRGIELTFNVPNGSVIGSVVRQNATTGQAAFDGMVGNQ